MINFKITKKIEYLNSILANQHTFEKILLAYIEKFTSSLSNISPDYLNDVLDFLNNLEKALLYASDNIKLINSTLNILNNIKDESEEELENIFTGYYETLSSISKNNEFIEELILNIIKFMEFKFYDKNEKVISTNYTTTTQDNEDTEISDNTSSDNQNREEIKIPDTLIENTLVISETKGKVILPYYFKDLKSICNSEEKIDYENIVEKNYTLPINNFKTPSISRFREAFKLARKKEKTSIKFAFDLGMELLFNYNLHPAIITACRTLDELDIYLDYLENNETEKFNCFNIVFEIAPVVSKKDFKG